MPRKVNFTISCSGQVLTAKSEHATGRKRMKHIDSIPSRELSSNSRKNLPSPGVLVKVTSPVPLAGNNRSRHVLTYIRVYHRCPAPSPRYKPPEAFVFSSAQLITPSEEIFSSNHRFKKTFRSVRDLISQLGHFEFFSNGAKTTPNAPTFFRFPLIR